MKRIIIKMTALLALLSISNVAFNGIGFSQSDLSTNYAHNDAISVNATIANKLEQTIEGSISIIWDVFEDADTDVIYYLTRPTGEEVQLSLVPEIRDDYHSFAITHRDVVVYGYWDIDQSKFIVNRFEENLKPVNENGINANRETGWVIDGSKITGNTPWITVLCKFPDIPDEPHDMNYYLEMYGIDYPGLDHYWREASDNVINLAGSTAVGWYTLPSPSSEYLGIYNNFYAGQAYTDCLAAADADVDFSQYYGVNLMFNQQIGSSFAMGGCGTRLLEGEYRDAGVTWTFPGENGGLANLAHEMGHGYCLPHSFVNDGTDPYRNIWDLMSNAYASAFNDMTWGFIPKHTIALNKYNLGWIDESKVLVVESPFTQQITLGRTAQPQTDDYRMVKILINNEIIYTLETRQTIFWYERDLPADAVIIHKYDNMSQKISFVDADYDGISSDEEAYWTVGETYVDPEYGLTFTVVGVTDTGFILDLSVYEMQPFEGCTAQSVIPPTECEALVDIYNALDGPNWVSAPGWLIHPDPCVWPGVTCTDGHVTQLGLYTELNGSLPSTIKDLVHLERLMLFSGNLVGGIPSSIGELINLNELRIEGNLGDPLPPEIGSLINLMSLDLRGNQITGSIPPEIGNLGNLVNLDLFGNQITGKIPAELGALNQLEVLRLSYNNLSGTIPPELGNLTNLKSMIVDDNPLHGYLPMTLTNLDSIFTVLFRNTNLCEPDDPAFIAWKEKAINWSGEGSVCIVSFLEFYIPLVIK